MSTYERFASSLDLTIGSPEEEESFATYATREGGMHLYLLSWDELVHLRAIYTTETNPEED